jgi:hypothetical protein
MIGKPPSGWWRVVAMTYEADAAGNWIPVLRHEMYGPTQERAIEVYQAHMATDAFLHACSTSGRFQTSRGIITCRTETELQRVP